MAFRAAAAARKVVVYSEKGVFEVRSYNNLTVALDTVRHQYVCAPTNPADPCMNQLRSASYSGDRTLVCALCYAGIGAAPGTRVPVVVKGRIRGDRRPHFAHPPGRGPAGGGHEPESVWHLASKALVEAWARAQPGVSDVRNEVWLPNHERRCDVRVVFADGSHVAVEAQGYRLTDAEWTARHDDYRRNGVIDVWLWHPDSPIPWVVLGEAEHPQQLWTFDPRVASATLMVGAPHHHRPFSTETDAAYRVQHLPPCTGDDLVPHEFPLSDLILTTEGIAVPEGLTRRLAAEQEEERLRARAAEDERAQARSLPNLPPRLTIVPTNIGSISIAKKNAAVPESRDRAALAQLDCIVLQNALMAVGHDIDYRDAPNLPLPRISPRPVRCVICGDLFPPDLRPKAVPKCHPAESDGGLRTIEPTVRVGRAGYLEISAAPSDPPNCEAIRRGA